MLRVRPILLTAALALCAGAASATIDYPVDVSGTAGRWALLHVSSGVLTRHRTWPVADGGPVPGLDPAYVYLLSSRAEPPDYDSRLQAYQCTEVIDVPGNRLTTTCVAPARPAQDLVLAVGNVAGDRVDAALRCLGYDSADVVRMVGLLSARVSGRTLSAAQAADLAGFQAAAVEYVDLVRQAETDLVGWVLANPGLVPDVGEAAWPPLPPGCTLPESEG
jgi:hypothetical protein